ncbi:MAG: bi-domain-containing oxidoreductase, partial [Candidatus Hodarchaeota archaeon]
MLQIVQNYKTGKVSLKNIPDPKVKPGCLLVRNAYSVVSIGTERMKVDIGKKSLVGKARERPEQVKQLIEHAKKTGLLDTYKKAINRIDRLTPLGYSSAGIVEEVGEGVTGFKAGDRVACGGSGHAEYIIVPKNLCALVPESVSLEAAAFTTLGAIALHSVRQSEATVGDNIAVIGLGLVGQIVVQVLNVAGCGIVGIDIDDMKLKVAKEGGVDLVVNRDDKGLIRRIFDFSNGFGVDAVIVTASTQTNDPIELAPKILRDRGKVIMVGISKMDIPWKSYYEKEIDIQLSRSYGPGRYDPVYEEKGMDYPVGYVRWTQRRNMIAFLELLSKDRIDLKKITTHRFDFREAEKLYENLYKNKLNNFLGGLFQYQENEPAPKIEIAKKREKWRDETHRITIGMIGAGNFTRNTILPIIKKMNFLNLRGIATETGISARDIQEKIGFDYSSANAKEIIEDVKIDTVIIATRHDTHSKLVAEALRKNKNVFVEKPLAVSSIQLQEVTKCHSSSKGILMVGFNRRFSSLVQEIKNAFANKRSPIAVNYRINAGIIPAEHWYQDLEKGGGRIIGEGCHFVDLIQFITGEKPIRVYAESLSTGNKLLANDDTVNLTIKLSGGSIATINYIACGDASYPKERIEVLGENSVAVLDDFKILELVKDGRKKNIKCRSQDKGHEAEFRTFFNAILGNAAAPISFEEIRLATLVTFAAVKSYKKGIPIHL